VRTLHALLIGALAVVSLPKPVVAQAELEPREFVVDVAPNLKPMGLSPTERVLMFDKPVQIPGARLSAGPYIFSLVAPSLLRVTDTTRARIYATFFVIPVSRVDADYNGQERIKFQQLFDDSPPRIVAWYMPGGTGYEFTYPKPKRQSPDRRFDR
jgi:hypothetical protein